jgi:hypothetical protein
VDYGFLSLAQVCGAEKLLRVFGAMLVVLMGGGLR